MNRREFMKQSVAVSMAAAGPPCFDNGKTFVDASAGRGRTVTLAAKPRPIDLNLGKTVVMVVDMQNDFGSKGGMFDRAGLDISIIQRAVPPTARVLTAARKAQLKIVYLKMGIRPDLSDIGVPDAPNWISNLADNVVATVHLPNGKEGRILIRDTWNTDIVDELAPEPRVLYKHRFSGFFETDLDAQLKRMGARYIIFTGCTTSIAWSLRFAMRCSANIPRCFSLTAQVKFSVAICLAPITMRRCCLSRNNSDGFRVLMSLLILCGPRPRQQVPIKEETAEVLY